MWTLDTSVWMRAADPTDSHHADAQALLDILTAQTLPVYVPRLLLAELAGAVSRVSRDPMRGRLAAQALREMPIVQLVTLDDALLDSAADLAADYALRGADACFVAVAQRYTCTLVSLDREMRERGARVVRTATPTEALAELQQRG